MTSSLAGKNIAILVANGFEETDMTSAQRALIEAGAKVRIVSSEQGLVNGWHDGGWGHYFPVDAQIDTVLGSDLDALIVPGGERSMAKLAQSPHTARIVRSVIDSEKPAVFVAEGVGALALAERIEGRTVAATQSIAETVRQAGATVSEQAEAVDGRILTISLSKGAAETAGRITGFLAPAAPLRDAA